MYSSISTAQVVIASVLPVFALAAVALRVKARRYSKAGIGADDYIIFAALIALYGSTAFVIFAAVAGGLGDSERNIFTHPTEAANFAKFIWAGPIVATTVIALIKVSTLVLYQRIFIIPKFRLACNIMIGLTAGWFLASIFAQIFSSKPVSQGWTNPGHNTINEPAFLLSMGAINMVLDIVTVCLPLSVIRTLHMSLKRKWSVAGVFALGFTLYYSVLLLNTPNNPNTPFTDDTSLVVVWSYIEECTSLVAACLPTLAPLLKNGRGLSTGLQRLGSLFSIRDRRHKRPRSGRTEGTSGNSPESKSARTAWQKLHSGGHTTEIARGSDVALAHVNPEPANAISIQSSVKLDVSSA